MNLEIPFYVQGGKYLSRALLQNSVLLHLDAGETDQTIESLVCFATVLHQEYGGNKTLKSINLNRVVGHPYYRLLSDKAAHIVGKMLQVRIIE